MLFYSDVIMTLVYSNNLHLTCGCCIRFENKQCDMIAHVVTDIKHLKFCKSSFINAHSRYVSLLTSTYSFKLSLQVHCIPLFVYALHYVEGFLVTLKLIDYCCAVNYIKN